MRQLSKTLPFSMTLIKAVAVGSAAYAWYVFATRTSTRLPPRITADRAIPISTQSILSPRALYLLFPRRFEQGYH